MINYPNRCFDAWRNRVTNVKALERKKKEEREMSNERKIELFINAIAEKQKELSRQRKSATNCTTINNCETSQRCQSAPEEITENSSSSSNPAGRNSLRRRCKSNSQTRFQVQKKIIEEQRFKLAEQNRIIEEMRLREIERDARRANKETMDAAKGALALCGRRTRRSLTHLMRENGCRYFIFLKKVYEFPAHLNFQRILRSRFQNFKFQGLKIELF